MDENYVFGMRAVIETLKSDKEIEKVLIKKDSKSEQWSELYKLLKERDVPYQFVPIEKLNRITRKAHQGVIAYVSPIEYQNIEMLLPQLYEAGKTPLFLVLDKVTDVRNFGSIARTAECSGINAIIVSAKGKALITSDAVKTSAGALNTMPVCRVNNLDETIVFLKNSGIQIVAATEKTENLIYQVDFKMPTAIIMGSEETGISFEYLKLADCDVKIPIQGKIESLNVAVAAGVIAFEAVRQRINS